MAVERTNPYAGLHSHLLYSNFVAKDIPSTIILPIAPSKVFSGKKSSWSEEEMQMYEFILLNLMSWTGPGMKISWVNFASQWINVAKRQRLLKPQALIYQRSKSQLEEKITSLEMKTRFKSLGVRGYN